MITRTKIYDGTGKFLGTMEFNNHKYDMPKPAELPKCTWYGPCLHQVSPPESIPDPYPRANAPWPDFEHENLRGAFQSFVKDRSMKQGRTEGAILSRIRRFMPPV
jgi:hypothetical protein